jgi:glutamyl/glutaminyl-tRNA synthetase
MARKKEIESFMERYQPVIRKTGDQFAKAVKTAEEDLSKLYKKTQLQLDIQMKNFQKEKLYYDIGKILAEKIISGEIEHPDFKKFRKQLKKIESENKKTKKKIKAIDKIGKAKSDTSRKGGKKKTVRKKATGKSAKKKTAKKRSAKKSAK